MKQLYQSAQGGAYVADVPSPIVTRGHVLVRSAASLVSVGTERMVAEFANKNLLGKARARPDAVRQILEKARREGVLNTVEAVTDRLGRPLALGYACAGTVIEVGQDVEHLRPGDLVACGGASSAVHAEVVNVPKNLVVKVPDETDPESAAFATLGAIALHATRLAEVKLGEVVAVIGLGLVGQLAVQVLKAAGCAVIGMDLQPSRAERARQAGAEAAAVDVDTFVSDVFKLSSGHGVDATLITAETPSHQPVELAGKITRERGIVVAVGTVGLQIPRPAYYEKEIDFRISRSYGPGRYDPEYEEKGHDYPIGYVRWTENRNMQAFAQLLGAGKVDVKSCITHRFPIDNAPEAYKLITAKDGESFLGVVISYPSFMTSRTSTTSTKSPATPSELIRRVDLLSQPPAALSLGSPERRASVAVGLLGAGNFATATLIPAMKKVPGLDCIGVCAASGLSARHAGDKFGFRYCTTDENEILDDSEVRVVVIATRHHLHARQVLAALKAGKHIFCEKPLCSNEQELAQIVQAYAILRSDEDTQELQNGTESDGQRLLVSPQSLILMVGYNRRFAPMAGQLKDFCSEIKEPLVMHYRINAGYIPPNHWVHDPAQGGGRIIGEVCHFVDFLSFLTDAVPVRVHAWATPNNGRYQDDNVTASLEFENGSVGTITYVANGDSSVPKERIEVFGGGRVALLDDFRRLELVRHGRKKVFTSRLRQDKGHRGEWVAFLSAVHNEGPLPISFASLTTTTLSTFAMLESLKTGLSVAVNPNRKGEVEAAREGEERAALAD